MHVERTIRMLLQWWDWSWKRTKPLQENMLVLSFFSDKDLKSLLPQGIVPLWVSRYCTCLSNRSLVQRLVHSNSTINSRKARRGALAATIISNVENVIKHYTINLSIFLKIAKTQGCLVRH